MRMRLSGLDERFGLRIIVDGDFKSLGPISSVKESQLVFIENSRFIQYLMKNPGVSCVLTTEKLISSIPKKLGLAVCENPRKTYYLIHNHLVENTKFYGNDFKSH